MMRDVWTRALALAGLALMTAVGVSNAQQPTTRARPTPAPAPAAAGAPERRAGDLPGPIDSLSDLQDTAKLLFKMVDTNDDGQISQKEANNAGNLLIGGFFFRADTNGDGVVSPDEVRAAREQLFQQKPYLRVLLERSKNEARTDGKDTNPVQTIGALLDANNDKQLQASEVRQAVETGVNAFFSTADTNRDGQLTPTELNAAAVGIARSAAQTAFRNADKNQDGQLSKAEFNKALEEPANRLFAMMDANGDGQLSQQEAQNARQFVVERIRAWRVPTAPNSPIVLMRSGTKPDDVAPVPNFNLSTPTRANTAPAPAPAPTTRPTPVPR